MKQQTLKKEVVFSGLGIFTSTKPVVRLCPAPIGTGIVFRRVDLQGKPEVAASLENVQETPRCTCLKAGEASIHTVEHLLAALKASDIDNLVIEISGPEVPISDGSSALFVKLIHEAGVLQQEEKKEIKRLKQPLHWSQGDVHLVALPAEEYRISYTLHYPHSPYLKSQYYSVAIDREKFTNEIAPCRTFCLYEEIEPLIKSGILKGGGLENGVVIKGETVLNPEGVRFPDEMVRHKILDVVGDLSLIGFPFFAHIIAIRSGHSSNRAFAKQLAKELK